MSRWPRVVLSLGAVALAAPLPVAAAAAPAPSPSRATTALAPMSSAPTSQWGGVASADGARVGVVVNDFLVVSNLVDAGGPTAQATTSALDGSQALAAYPYPGELVLTAHGLSQGAAPNYPLIAQSNNSTRPVSDVGQGPYDLHAQSADNSAKAVAQATAGGGGLAAGTTRTSAAVVHDPASGTVTADADATMQGLSFGGVLSVGRFHSHADLVSTPGGPLRRTSDTEAADVTVGGQQVGLSDKGLVLFGTDVPLPPDSAANAILASAGITVHYLAASASGSSVVAPGLSIALTQDVPGVGETTVTYVLGQAAASAAAAGASAGTGTSAGYGAGFPAPSRAMSAGTAPPGPAPRTMSGPLVPPTAGVPPVTAPTSTPGTRNYRLAAVAGASSASLYVVVAAGALVMVAAAQLFRVLAVKLTWS